MLQIVVLLKLVPDIRHIPEDAWDLERGTLKRNRLSLIPNPLDDRALALALRIRSTWGGCVTALSMGPPAAVDVCARALAFGADNAVLITDRACAGSDTLATATVLSAAVREVAADPARLLVISGMQSPDGDTAQVPVQVAAMLNAAVVPYVTGAADAGDGAERVVELVSLASVGSLRTILAPDTLPAVVTCTERLPSISFHTSLEALERADPENVATRTAADLGLAPEVVGLAGSATRVISIAVAQSVRRAVQRIDWPDHGDRERRAAEIVHRLRRGLSEPHEPATPPEAHRRQTAAPATEHGVWAALGPGARPEQLGILAHARSIADDLDCPAVACVTAGAYGGHTELYETVLSRAGATDLLLIEGADPADPVTAALYLEHAVRHFAPQVVLLPASPEGRVTAPYLAARLGAGLTADCTVFVVKSFTARRAGTRRTYRGVVHQQRPALGGNIQATIVSPQNIERGLPQMATVRPGPTVEHAVGPLRRRTWCAPEAPTARPVLAAVVPDAVGGVDGGRIEIEQCRILVSVGRGVGGETGIRDYAQPLAQALRERFGVDVEISASRMVVDAGDLPRERQVGQTGKVVAPDIYIALGISGAVQHRAGMDASATIVAVNADADAPITAISDVFVHGRVEEVVPALVRALEC